MSDTSDSAKRWWELHNGSAHDARRAYEKRNSQELVTMSTKALLQMLPAEPRATVVDVGCGDGTLLRQLTEWDAADRYIGIDPNSPRVTMPKIEFIRDSAEHLHKLVATLDGDVAIVATLTVGLWNEPEHVLFQVLADHDHVHTVFIADIVRPTSDRAWAIWRSFALDDEELRYLDDHGSVLLTARRWARFASGLANDLIDIEVHVETFDIRTPGIGGRVWPVEQMDAFMQHLEAVTAPQGIVVRTSRRRSGAQSTETLENGSTK